MWCHKNVNNVIYVVHFDQKISNNVKLLSFLQINKC